MRRAVELIVWEAHSITDAAKTANVKEDTLRANLRKPHVRKLLNDMHNQWLSTAGQMATARIENLATASNSDHVKLQANQWVAGVAGIAPVQKVDATVQHTLSYQGLGFADGLVDITPPKPDGDTA